MWTKLKGLIEWIGPYTFDSWLVLILVVLFIHVYCHIAARTAAITLNWATDDFCFNALNITSKRKLDMNGIYIFMVVAVFAFLKMIYNFNVRYPIKDD